MIFEIFIGFLTKDLNRSNFMLNLGACSRIIKFICHFLFLFLNFENYKVYFSLYNLNEQSKPN